MTAVLPQRITRVVGARPRAAGLPPGFRVVLDPGVRRRPRPDGGVLLGGSPPAVLRLNQPAWATLTRLAEGLPVRDGAQAVVAARIVDAGLARPVPPGGPGVDDVTVVVPVRDRPGALARCLRAIGPAAAVVVVDDASRDPEAVRRVAAAAGAEVVQRTVNGGPAAARNTGLALCQTRYVAFVDSDCEPEPSWLTGVLPHFADPDVAAVAPRVVGQDRPGWLARYEQARSSLDLGGRAGPVVPRSRISYVPAAALVARRSALGGGFDEDLPVGEDVDLVWRLHAAGWRVRYEPFARVRHDHRVCLSQWARRKFDYGTSAAPLALRHPGSVPPAVTSLVALVPLLLLRARRPWLAGAAAALAAAGLTRRLPAFPGRAPEAARLAFAGSVTTALGLAKAATRAWLPATLVVAAARPADRRTLVAATLAVPLVDWIARRPDLDPLRWTAAHVLDDASYCAGLWTGALRSRTLAPLLPAVPELAALPRLRKSAKGKGGVRQQ
jgi:mycofactocin system glycosyltransferase